MLNAMEAYAKGLEDGKQIALEMLNSALNIQAENIGHAIAHVMILNNQLAKAKQDYECMKLDSRSSKADWK